MDSKPIGKRDRALNLGHVEYTTVMENPISIICGL